MFTPGGQGKHSSESKTKHQELVVGWLVILNGPGQGISLPIGYGLNPVGRDKNERIRLDFGDDQISRTAHCAIIFDDRNLKFFIKHGESQNLTYIDDTPVLAPTELHANTQITLGNTTLLFVPLCGEHFEWTAHLSTEGDK